MRNFSRFAPPRWNMRCTCWRRVRKTYIDPKDAGAIRVTTLRRVLTYVRPHWRSACVVLFCIALGAVLSLALPWFIKRIVDVAIPRRDVRLLWLYSAGMMAGPLAAGLLGVVRKYTAETIGQQVMFDLRVALYRHLHAMPFAFFASQRPGEAVSHVLNDVQGVGSAVSDTLVDIVDNVFVLAATTAFVFALDWRLALLSMVCLPLFVVPTRRIGRARKALKRTAQERVSELTGILTETLSVSGALLVKVFGGEEAEVRRFSAKAAEIKTLSLKQTLIGRWFRMLLGLFESIGPAMVFALGGLLVIRGHLALGTIIAFVTVLKRLYGPASDLAAVHVDLVTSYAYFDRVFNVLDRDASIRDAPGARELPRVEGRIDFHDVSFTYDGCAASLSDINLTIPGGTSVGIVGPSGSGKTTLAGLVARLYDPDRGSMAIDGIDLRDVTVASLRANMAVVTQETFLFHTSVLENLRYARPEAPLSDVEEAARAAQIHDVIAALPEGYDTLVGERGYRFSAGERQRLAVARALLRDPRILILDEATSSLDAVAERDVQQALVPLRSGRTTLIIAHRLSAVVDADLIVVLDRGRIVEWGTHEQLLARPGLYAWLWQVQSRDETLAPARSG